MSIFDGIATRASLIKAGLSKNPDAGVRMAAQKLFTPRWSYPPQRNSYQWADLFMKSPRMAPIHKIAADVAVAQYKLYKDSALPGNRINEHVFLKLMKKPNPNTEMTEFFLLYMTEVYRLLPSGEAFWLIERNGLGVPTEIWLVPPFWVMQTPSEPIPYFRILPQGNTSYQMLYVDPRDMIWFKEPDPLNPYGRGRGRAEAVGDEIETDEYMAKWAKKFFFNDAIPHMVGMMPGADEPTVTRQSEQWNAKYGGHQNNSKTAWINWDAKLQVLKETNKEMDFSQSRKDLRDACNQFWNMSPELFGILENSNRSTIDAAYDLYAKNVFSVRLRTFDDVINRQLLPQFDPRLVLAHDNVVPNDKEFELKKAESGLKNGGITVDEWRVTNGYEPLPDGKGQILYTPLNMVPTDLSTGDIISSSPAAQESGEDGKSVKKKSLTNKQKAVIWKSLDNTAVKHERQFEKACKKFFQGQQDRVTDALMKKSASGMISKAATDNPDDLADWEQESKKLYDALEPYWIDTMKDAFEYVNDLYSFDLNFDVFNKRFKDFISRYGLDQAKNINDTTKSKLRVSLSEGIEAGESIPKLRQRVSDIYSDAKGYRSKRIAVTETHNTVGSGTFETYKGAAVGKKEWLTSIDGRERESHGKINGEIVGIDKPFSNGLMFPGDACGAADEVVGCRCALLPVIQDEDE